MPVERAFEIFGALRIFLHVERDLVDLVVGAVLHFGRECAERLGEGDLLVIVEIDLGKHQHAALFQQFTELRSQIARQQFRLAVQDAATDVRLDLFMRHARDCGACHVRLSSVFPMS